MLRYALPFLSLLALFASPAGAYTLLGAAWNADKGPVRFHLDPNGSDDIDDGSDLQAVRNAFRSWSCVPGSRLRLEEGSVPGAKEAEADDGRNSVFWDEDGTFGLGVATLGVALGPASDDGSMIERGWATIIFNGVHHTWTTSNDRNFPSDKVDVESIAVHEAGHWIGLGHSCEDAAETVCLGPDKSVMHPTYPGGRVRELFADDEEGARALYPQDPNDDSTCQGPFRQGERCGCNDECIEGLLCVATDEGGICAPRCSSEDVTCPEGFLCLLGAAEADGVAPGICARVSAAEGAPPGAICQRDSDCAKGLCARAAPVGRTVCRVSCDVDSDCPSENACVEGVCLSSAARDGIACPDLDEGCMCMGAEEPSSSAPVTAFLLVGLLGLFAFARVRNARALGRQPGAKRAGTLALR